MTAHAKARQLALTTAFLTAARRYWFSVFPCICREAQHWRKRATQIPDPALRRLALEAQRVKRGNIEGSAAFAAFAPRGQRATAVRAQVAFQSAYDYVDTLSEQSNQDPVISGRHLHQALLVAVDRNAPHPDYYARYPYRNDGGYLEEIVDACRESLTQLPSCASITVPAQRLSQRIVAYQSLNLNELQGGHDRLREWALNATPPETGLRWWETAASAGSSLGVFALIAAAGRPVLAAAEAVAIEGAYWPWIGALHSLLDSLVDEAEDAAAGQRSLLSYYSSPEETAERLQHLTEQSLCAIGALPDAREHALILAGMASFYLTARQTTSPAARLVSARVLETLGSLARPSLLVLKTRRAASTGHERSVAAVRNIAMCRQTGKIPLLGGRR
jgi:tetraprenyl-beta-curcumene synthase